MTHDARITRGIAIALAAVVAVSLLASFVALGHHQAPSNDLCGATITEDLKLDHDLVCTGSGLAVGANNVKIWLKGHTITGPGNVFGGFAGIIVNGWTNVEIVGPGTIKGFFVGIAVMGSTDVTVEKLSVVGNGRIGGQGIRVVSSTDVDIGKNVVTGNLGDGVGIRLSTDVLVEKNEIRGNNRGISLGGTSGNAVEKNWIVGNTCGVRGPIGDNTIEKNRFEANGADFC